MEAYAWLEQAEAHGHGWESRFSRELPELLTRNRDRQVVNGNLSFAYPEAIEFRLAILREMLEYRFDGIAIDFQKGGDHRNPRRRRRHILCPLRPTRHRSLCERDRTRPLHHPQ